MRNCNHVPFAILHLEGTMRILIVIALVIHRSTSSVSLPRLSVLNKTSHARNENLLGLAGLVRCKKLVLNPSILHPIYAVVDELRLDGVKEALDTFVLDLGSDFDGDLFAGKDDSLKELRYVGLDKTILLQSFKKLERMSKAIQLNDTYCPGRHMEQTRSIQFLAHLDFCNERSPLVVRCFEDDTLSHLHFSCAWTL